MPLVTSNPWTDAAAYGSGLADTLGQIFLGIPRQRFEMAQMRAEAPLQRQLLEARIGEAEAKPKIEEEMERFREGGMAERVRHDMAMENARADSIQNQLNKPPSENETTTQANTALNGFLNNLATQMNIEKDTPISIDPTLSSSVIGNAMSNRNKPGDNPEMDSIQYLTKIAPILDAVLSTNISANPVSHGLFGGTTTNYVPNTVTNGYVMRAPEGSLQQQVQQAPQQQVPQQQTPQQFSLTATNAQGQRAVFDPGKGQWVIQ